MGYGTGAIMAVPAHDERDLEFARQEGIEVRLVYHPEDREVDPAELAEPILGEGVIPGHRRVRGRTQRGRHDRSLHRLDGGAGLG